MNIKKYFLFLLFIFPSCALYKTPVSEVDNVYYNEYMAIAAKNQKELACQTKLPEPPNQEVNDDIKNELQYFLKQDRMFILNSHNNRLKFEPMIKKIFEDYGVPGELATIALIESQYRPDATSRSGAAGMWQFMKGTGQLYGLTVSIVKDERKDPVLSTIAAAKHLRDLYMAYNDWYLAIAAYNAGMGAVNRTITKVNSKDFWVVKRHLRTQTQRYVARFIAANMILNDLDYWGFKLEDKA